MKAMKRLCILLAIAFFHTGLFAQLSEEDVHSEGTESYWLGLDFSQFKIRGEDVTPEKLKEFMVGWNSLILKEEEKYNLEELFHKEKVEREIDPALEKLDALNPEERIADGISGEHKLEEDQVKEVANSYKMKDKEGALGILFVMEEFNKIKEYGSMHVVFLDLGSGEIVKSERLQTEPGGIGFRNYWARTYYNGMREIQKELK